MRCRVVNCEKKAVWLHTYDKSLSVCEEHYQKYAAAMLGSIKSEKKAAAARENGKKGRRPKVQ